jgi:hypothetical protein
VFLLQGRRVWDAFFPLLISCSRSIFIFIFIFVQKKY